MMLAWDVTNGVARRSWSGNARAQETIQRTMQKNSKLMVTMPNEVDFSMLDELL